MKQCKCGETAKLVEVKKEGPNHGRKFYACSKPMNEQCDYFEWADGIVQARPPKASTDNALLASIASDVNAIKRMLESSRKQQIDEEFGI